MRLQLAAGSLETLGAQVVLIDQEVEAPEVAQAGPWQEAVWSRGDAWVDLRHESQQPAVTGGPVRACSQAGRPPTTGVV